MDNKKQGILGIVIGVVVLGGFGWYNTNAKLKLAQQAATEVCECLKKNTSNDISGTIQKDVCLRLLNNDGFRDISKNRLQKALESTCPDLSKQVKIIEN